MVLALAVAGRYLGVAVVAVEAAFGGTIAVEVVVVVVVVVPVSVVAA